MKKNRELKSHFRKKKHSAESTLAELERDLPLAQPKDVPPSPEELELLNIDYEITPDPLPDSALENLPEKDKAKFKKGYGFLFEKPKRAISIFKELSEAHPHIPTLQNNLLVALSSIKSKSEVQQLNCQQYETFPNYLFAKTNYILYLVESERLEEVPSVLQGKYKLNLLYPERKIFHVTEHITFLGALGHYYAALGRVSFADSFCDLIEEWDEEAPIIGGIQAISMRNPITKVRLLQLLNEEMDLEEFDAESTDEQFGEWDGPNEESNPLSK